MLPPRLDLDHSIDFETIRDTRSYT